METFLPWWYLLCCQQIAGKKSIPETALSLVESQIKGHGFSQLGTRNRKQAKRHRVLRSGLWHPKLQFLLVCLITVLRLNLDELTDEANEFSSSLKCLLVLINKESVNSFFKNSLCRLKMI